MHEQACFAYQKDRCKALTVENCRGPDWKQSRGQTLTFDTQN